VTAALERAEAPPDYAAAVSSLAHRERSTGILAIEGPDRVAFLQGQLTQDVKTLATGQTLPAAGLTPKGKLIYFGRVLALTDRILLLLPAACRSAAAAHLGKYAVFQKVTARDATAELFEIGLYGPRARTFEPPSAATALPPDGELAGGILAPVAMRAELDARLAAAGSRLVQSETAEILRVESGRPRFGKDADESNLPDEIGLRAAISTTKGCYVGQEVVARLRTYGRVNRRLVGLRFPAGVIPAGTVILDPHKPDLELLRVGSSVVSPRLGPIGLGLAFRDIADGSALTAPDESGRVALVTPLPFA
jgi:folate-binding protein YgfZ